MLAIVKLSGNWYKREINFHNQEDCDDVETFVEEGNPVLLVEDEDDIPDEIIIEED